MSDQIPPCEHYSVCKSLALAPDAAYCQNCEELARSYREPTHPLYHTYTPRKSAEALDGLLLPEVEQQSYNQEIEYQQRQKKFQEGRTAARLDHEECSVCGIHKDHSDAQLDYGICIGCRERYVIMKEHKGPNIKPISRKVGQKIDGTSLTPYSYRTGENLVCTWYKCDCGSEPVLLPRSRVEGLFIRDCGPKCGLKKNARLPTGNAPGRPRIYSKYQVGEQVPGTHLTVDSIDPLVYRCVCGKECLDFSRTLVEGGYRKSCGECAYSRPPKKCVFCGTVGREGREINGKRICESCLSELK